MYDDYKYSKKSHLKDYSSHIERKKSRSKSRSRNRHYHEKDYRDYRDKDKYGHRSRKSRDNNNSRDRNYSHHRSRPRKGEKHRERSNEKERSKERIKNKSKSRHKERDESKSKKREKQSKFTEQSGFTSLPSDIYQINMDPNNSQFFSLPNESSSFQVSTNLNQALTVQDLKTDRKLYIGNLQPGMPSATLVQTLNSILLSKTNNFAPGEPIVSAWISSDGRYAFIEFRTAEEANQGFILNGSLVQGQPIKVGRPKTYSGSATNQEESNISNTVAAVLQSGTMIAPVKGVKVQFPTKILCFINISKDINIEEEEQYEFVKEDIMSECELYGKVVSVFLPRKDIEDNLVPGMGNAYVEFETIDDCKNCRRKLVGRRFNGRLVRMIYFSEEKFKEGHYGIGDEEEDDDKTEDNRTVVNFRVDKNEGLD